MSDIQIKTVKTEWDVYFDMALTMLDEITRNNQSGKKTVMIVPVGPTAQYPLLAQMVNTLRVSLKNVYFFNMDEYLITPTEAIAEDDPLSFHKRMNEEFYSLVDPGLVMAEDHRFFPEPGREKEYDEKIAELGGVDLCLGGLGITGHIAFNEPPETEDPAFPTLGTRVLPITRETRTINANGYLRGDIAGMPKWCITVGMKQILASRRVYIALNRDWQHGIFKRVLHDEISSLRPASYLRTIDNVLFVMPEQIAKGL